MRVLYSFGVIDKNDVAFMMGNINIIGEHLANQIFHKINHVAKDETVRKVLALIGKDESRHIAAGQRFFGEVFSEFEKNRHKIIAKNLATTLILVAASYDLVNPMRALKIDLAEILDAMYRHYTDITNGLPAFPEQALLESIVDHLRRGSPHTVRVIQQFTDAEGNLDAGRFVAVCEKVVRSPRALRDLFAA